jgi:geranylgeranyl diphosphate synthase type II
MVNIAILEDKRKGIEVALHDVISQVADKDSLISEIFSHTVFSAGKRLRPLLTLIMYEMLGGTKGNIYTCACVTELIHVATLVLDDLPCMDNSHYRRGQLSCHAKFGDANAMLMAFGLAAESFRILSDKNNFQGISGDRLLGMVQEVSYKIGFSGLIGGQIADLNSGTSLSQLPGDEQKLHYITSNKTAVLFEVCALIACCLAEADQKDKDRMIAYAHNVGLALQIYDDLQDTSEDKGLSFSKFYGATQAKEMLQQKIKTSQDCIVYTNEHALLLKELPHMLLKVS